MKQARNLSPSSLQGGAVLLVAVVLLLLAGIMTVFALNVGIFEQRSTANDLRAKAVNDAAEAGLARGFEFLMRQHPSWMESNTIPGGAQWTLCGSTEVEFPCGSIPQFEPDGTTPRRATMYKYVRAAGGIADIADPLDAHMLPLTNAIDAVGSFPVAYGVAPVLCRVKRPDAGEAATTPVRCSISLGQATNQRIVTFVSVAKMPSEAASSTLTQVIGKYALLENVLGKPPITASGSVDLVGTLQVVTNPDAGGPGVPVSVWTRRNVSKSGTPNTCYADEFFRYGTKAGPGGTPAIEGGILTCDACGCDGDKSLSFAASGAPAPSAEGIDILDIDGDIGINRDVIPSEFPCDMFEYVFGAKSWADISPVDSFCEKKLTAPYTPSWNQTIIRTIGIDEAYLYKNALSIIVNDALPFATEITTGSGKVKSSAWLTSGDADVAGLIWCQAKCGIGPNQQVGTPLKPVVLVIDGDVTIQGRVFGFVFVRATGSEDLSEVTGGNAVLTMNGKAAIYGAVVVQGEIEHANGTAAVIHSTEVLKRIADDENNTRNASLPGAWTDLKSY